MNEHTIWQSCPPWQVLSRKTDIVVFTGTEFHPGLLRFTNEGPLVEVRSHLNPYTTWPKLFQWAPHPRKSISEETVRRMQVLHKLAHNSSLSRDVVDDYFAANEKYIFTAHPWACHLSLNGDAHITHDRSPTTITVGGGSRVGKLNLTELPPDEQIKSLKRILTALDIEIEMSGTLRTLPWKK